RRAAVAPVPGQEHPKQTVGSSQRRPFPGRALQDTDLVPESHVLQLQRSARAEHRTQRGNKRGQQDQHRLNTIFSKRTGFPIGTIETVPGCSLQQLMPLASAKSRLPSPLKSATATEAG